MKYILAIICSLCICSSVEAGEKTFRFRNGQIYRYDYGNGSYTRSSLQEYTKITGMDSYYSRRTTPGIRWYNPYTGQTYGYSYYPSSTYIRYNYGWRQYQRPCPTWRY